MAILRSSSWEITSSAWSKKMSEMLFNSDNLTGKTTLLLFYSKDFEGDRKITSSI